MRTEKFKASELQDFIRDYPHLTGRDLMDKYGLNQNQINYLIGKFGLKKSKETRARSAGKTVWTPDQDRFLRDNFSKMNNAGLARALGRKLTVTRTRLYELGLKRMEMEYWTPEQVSFLREHFRTMGDTELANIFQERWPKQKTWSKKHIEKKRRYLKLKRTRKERQAILEGHIRNGAYIEGNRRTWEKRGVAPDGTIRFWRLAYDPHRRVPFIKVAGRFVHYCRYRYEQLHGPVPKGFNAVFLDKDPYNMDDSNIGIVSNKEHAIRNAQTASVGLSDNYVAGMLCQGDKELRETIKTNHPELIKLKRNQLILNRKINESI